jgi:phosphatidylserine/phosphatidylglycerophosphate/cardiolipin synthase-like enzyme
MPISSLESAESPIQVYFTRPGSSPHDLNTPAHALARYIGQAQESIDVCAFELDNDVIIDALVAAVKRGVRVRLVTETDYLDESGPQALRAVGVPVVDDQRDGALMHNKFMVFDNLAVWTGSMNFTENCAYRNNNNGVYLKDARIAANYATKFSWMFDHRKFGGLPYPGARIPNPQVQLGDGTNVENYYSTHDRITDHVVNLVDKARLTTQFLVFSFTNDRLSHCMVGKARAGCKVQGVFERSQAGSSYSQYHVLRQAGQPVEVYTDANPRNMHHKVLIVDGETTVTGSFNLSASAEKENDENVLIIHNRKVAERFQDEFQRVFKDAKDAAPTGTAAGPLK